MTKILSAAIVLLAGMVATASAGEISKSNLKSMGFGSMQTISDNDGLAIRGKGTSASAWGSGSSQFHSTTGNGSATETTGYKASSSKKHGGSAAEGGNFTVVGQANGSVSSRGVKVNFVVIGSAGGSHASAH